MPKVQCQKGSLVSTIPKEVKTILGLKQGDFINFNISESGEIRVIKIEGSKK